MYTEKRVFTFKVNEKEFKKWYAKEFKYEKRCTAEEFLSDLTLDELFSYYGEGWFEYDTETIKEKK